MAPSDRIIKFTTLGLRLASFIIAATILALAITLIKSPPPASATSSNGSKQPQPQPAPQIIALLTFAIITALQAILATVLTLLTHERAWLSIGDILSICGYATSTLLLRGVNDMYHCRKWMHNNSDQSANTIMQFLLIRRAGTGGEPEAGECVLLKTLFGGAIAGCVISGLAVGMIVLGLKRREMERRRMIQLAREEVKRAAVQRAVHGVGISRSRSRDSEKGLSRF